MSNRVTLPSNIVGSPSLTKTAEGVTFTASPLESLLQSIPTPSQQPSMTPTPMPTVTPPMIPQQKTPTIPAEILATAASPKSPSPLIATAIPQKTQSPHAEVVEKKAQGYKFNLMNVVWLVVIFIAVFLILYASKINVVTDLENGERVINNKKLIFWSVLISIIIGVLGYIGMRLWTKNRA